jgi:hypothetical protein
MTQSELNQKFSTFLKAGYGAFMLAASTGYFGFEGKVTPILNPYTRNPYASLWQRGWDRAKSDYERGRPSNPEQFIDNRRVSDYAKERQQAQQRKQQGQQRFKQQKQSKQKGKAVQRPPQRPQPKPLTPATPANLERLSNKLTKKYRTVI